MNSASPTEKKGSALLIILAFVTLVTIVTVSFLLIARVERTTTSLALGRAEAEILADYAADVAIARIHEAIKDGMGPDKMWVSEPGRIRVVQRSDLSVFKDYDLFAALPGPDTILPDENSVDLNRPDFNGVHPIAPPAPGNTKATMKTGWKNVLRDPGKPADSANPIVARFAYWVDDESCKVNINTADGSRKYTMESFGFGTPSEISLQALHSSDGTQVSGTTATAISDYAWEHGFNSVAELARVPGITEDFVTHNAFNLTCHSKTPEVTFYGEPRMYLFGVIEHNKKTYTFNTGPYYSKDPTKTSGKIGPGAADMVELGGKIDFVYPTSRQLPLRSGSSYIYSSTQSHLLPHSIPQYPLEVGDPVINLPSHSATSRARNFVYLLRIVEAWNGTNALGDSFTWPAFGAQGASPATKYNVRQRDSMALQVLDISCRSVSIDHWRAHTDPSLSSGILGNAINPSARRELAIGLSRGPKLTEVYMSAHVGVSDPFATGHEVPYFQPRFVMEFYLPKYEGVPLDSPYAGSVYNWKNGEKRIILLAGSYVAPLNEQDINSGLLKHTEQGEYIPEEEPPVIIDPSNAWMGTLLRVPGVDLAGNPSKTQEGIPLEDPDQAKAAANHHPYCLTMINGVARYRGSAFIAHGNKYMIRSPFPFLHGIMSNESGVLDTWSPGVYHAQDDAKGGNFPLLGKIGATTFDVEGGVAFRSNSANNTGAYNWEVAPLDGLRGVRYTDEIPETIAEDLKQAVIPIEFTAPGDYLARVSDPLVNKFPGDWEKVLNPASSERTFSMPNSANNRPSIYAKGGGSRDPFFPPKGTVNPVNLDGDNPGFKPNGGGDPLSIWMPRQDVRYPKQSRFPSVGALNYVRTGIIPDDLSVSISQQKGVPWRCLSLSSNPVSQGEYPDWAMLDLFTVPFLPQKVYYKNADPEEEPKPVRKLTSNGATTGKLNINNPKIPYPFGESIDGVAQTPPERTAPLEALFLGIRTSTSYQGDDPKYETVDSSKAADLRKAVQDHLVARGPFLLPGQLSEVKAINDYTYDGVTPNAATRNDLMREVFGATTTQSNIFSIWVVAQKIKKLGRNTNPDIFEPGDVVIGESRRRYIVERLIECGMDGVPGNALNPGPDGVIGTEDDPIDANYHPSLSYPLPYRWRILSVEEVNL